MRAPRTTADPLVLLLAVTLVAWGDFFGYGMYNPTGLRLVAVGCIALAAAVLVGALLARGSAGHRWVLNLAVVTLVVWQGLVLVRATTYYGHGHWLTDARYLSIAVPTVGVAVLMAGEPASSVWWWVLVAAFGAGSLATINASPHPAIDVWHLIEHASSCVVHGCNPYTMHTPQAPGVQEGFNYLPMTAVLLVPFHAVFGDVRYGEALAILVAGVLLRRCGGPVGARAAALFFCVPGLFFAVEQAWNESLLVLLLVAAVWWVRDEVEPTRRWLVAALLLGVALATKQHMWLLLPVAALTWGWRPALAAAVTGGILMLPWIAVDPGAFWRETVTMFTHIAPRIDGLTLWLHEPAGAQTALAVVVLVAAYLLVWLCCRGLPHRFSVGAAVVLAGFDLMNKQSFFNQWLLVTWLVIAAIVMELRTAPERGRVSIVRREV